MTIINDDSRVINNLETSLTDNARVVTYNRHVFIVQRPGLRTQTLNPRMSQGFHPYKETVVVQNKSNLFLKVFCEFFLHYNQLNEIKAS